MDFFCCYAKDSKNTRQQCWRYPINGSCKDALSIRIQVFGLPFALIWLKWAQAYFHCNRITLQAIMISNIITQTPVEVASEVTDFVDPMSTEKNDSTLQALMLRRLAA